MGEFPLRVRFAPPCAPLRPANGNVGDAEAPLWGEKGLRRAEGRPLRAPERGLGGRGRAKLGELPVRSDGPDPRLGGGTAISISRGGDRHSTLGKTA